MTSNIKFGKFYIGHDKPGTGNVSWLPMFANDHRKFSLRALVLPVGFADQKHLIVFATILEYVMANQGKISLIKLLCSEEKFLYHYRIASEKEIAEKWKRA